MKKTISMALEAEDAEVIRGFCESSGLTITSLFETYAKTIVKTIRVSGWEGKKKHSKLDLIRLLGAGLKQQT